MQNTIGQPQPQSVQVPNYSGVNIQIFNPSVAAPGATLPNQSINAQNYGQAYPSNYYTQALGQPQTQSQSQTQIQAPAPAPAEPEKKKMEKREIVLLTDDYIKTLENYLNSKDPDERLMGGKQVMARLQEDESRKTDMALNPLVDKMLQDPSKQVKALALAILSTGAAAGDDKTVSLLKAMEQDKKANYGQDAPQATEILLKMDGDKAQKEFEVKDKPKKEEKKDKKA